jgi:Predicted membrane protein
VWGHPYWVSGETSLGESGVEPTLEARGIPPGEYVEFRVAFPRRLLASSDGATPIAGQGLPIILEEERRDAEAAELRNARIRAAVLWGLFFAVVPGLLAALAVYLRYGKEPRTTFDREYVQEPPDGLPPAEVAALLSQGKVDERAFTATVFDFISRGIVHGPAHPDDAVDLPGAAPGTDQRPRAGARR